jgi:hypothetical protein
MFFNHIKLDNPLPVAEQVDMNGIRKYMTPDGYAYPSVTTVISAMDTGKKEILEKWKKNVGLSKANTIKNNSAIRGKNLHSLCEAYLSNAPHKNHPALNAVEMFHSITPFLNRIDNIICLETPLYSHTLQVAGTVDCIGDFDGIESVIDFKNARSTRTEDMVYGYFIQETIYAMMFNEWMKKRRIKQIVTIMAVENSEPQLFIKHPDEYFDKALRMIVNYKKMNK